MNLPSIDTIMLIKDVTRESAVKVRAILKLRNLDAVCDLSPEADKYVRACFHTPPLQLVKLTAIDAIIGTYGVESIVPRVRTFRSPIIEYCNTGDSYALTVMWLNGRYSVGSRGDIVERGNYD